MFEKLPAGSFPPAVLPSRYNVATKQLREEDGGIIRPENDSHTVP